MTLVAFRTLTIVAVDHGTTFRQVFKLLCVSEQIILVSPCCRVLYSCSIYCFSVVPITSYGTIYVCQQTIIKQSIATAWTTLQNL